MSQAKSSAKNPHPLQGQLDLPGTERSKIIPTKGTPSYSAAESQGGGGPGLSSASDSMSNAEFSGEKEEVHVYLWRKFSAIVAEAAARSPERDINILITMKCTRMAGASNF